MLATLNVQFVFSTGLGPFCSKLFETQTPVPSQIFFEFSV